LIGSFVFMNWLNLGLTLAMGQPASPPGTQPNPQGQVFSTLGMFLIMGVMFYFLLIRPQSRKAKDHAQMLKTLRPGDKVITSGGVVGVVVTVREKTLSIRSADTKLEVTKAAIAEVTEREGEPSSS
jgi:preprotein translocase subunit YajC